MAEPAKPPEPPQLATPPPIWPDEPIYGKPPSPTSSHWGVAFADRLIDRAFKFAATFALAYLAYLGNKGVTKTEQVQTQQAQQVETAESVKAALDRKVATERAALEANLRASWKYLDSVAYESELPKDKEAAAAAKRAYEEFKAKNGNP